MNAPTCFNADDIRGLLSSELNEVIAYRIGHADAQCLDASRVVIGGDMSLRASKAEPLLRLNIEARGRAGLVSAKFSEADSLITQ